MGPIVWDHCPIQAIKKYALSCHTVASSSSPLAPVSHLHSKLSLYFPHSPQHDYLEQQNHKCSKHRTRAMNLNHKMISSTSQNIVILILDPGSENTELKYFCLKENLKTSGNSFKENLKAFENSFKDSIGVYRFHLEIFWWKKYIHILKKKIFVVKRMESFLIQYPFTPLKRCAMLVRIKRESKDLF